MPLGALQLTQCLEIAQMIYIQTLKVKVEDDLSNMQITKSTQKVMINK